MQAHAKACSKIDDDSSDNDNDDDDDNDADNGSLMIMMVKILPSMGLDACDDSHWPCRQICSERQADYVS